MTIEPRRRCGLRVALAARLASGAFAFAMQACSPAAQHGDSSDIKVGVLLPFTGELAASGAEYERALILAVESVNRAGGISGHQLRLVSRDTHSDVERGVESARELFEAGVVGVIGPEEPEVTLGMASMLAGYDSTQIIPSISSPRPAGRTVDTDWFHIAPGPRLLGCMIGTRLYQDGRSRVVIVNENDPFLFTLASQASRHYNALLKPGTDARRATATVLPYQPDAGSYSPLISSVTARAADSFVLLGYPESSAKIMANWEVSGNRAPLYLAPTLQSEAFRLNSPPGALEGGLGISADVSDDAKGFANAFAARWSGEHPMPMAYFYYDSLILLALALEAGYADAGSVPPNAILQTQLVKVSKEGPNVVAWNEVSRGLELAAAGEGIDYRGASGKLDLGEDGELLAGSGATFWRVNGDQVVPEAAGVCPSSSF